MPTQRWQHANGRRTHPDTDSAEAPDTADAAAERSFAGHDGAAVLDAAPVWRRPVARAGGMPQDVAEDAVIGAAIHNHPRGSRDDALARVTSADFTNPHRRATWAAVEELHRRGEPIDEITVLWHLHHASDPTANPSITTLRDTRTPAILYEQALHQLQLTRATSYTSATPRPASPDRPHPPERPQRQRLPEHRCHKSQHHEGHARRTEPDRRRQGCRPRTAANRRQDPWAHCLTGVWRRLGIGAAIRRVAQGRLLDGEVVSGSPSP